MTGTFIVICTARLVTVHRIVNWRGRGNTFRFEQSPGGGWRSDRAHLG
jgi:hypothetical protein